MNPESFVRHLKGMSQLLFKLDLTPTQVELAKDILFKIHKRIIIIAMTRYGKTMTIAMATLLFAFFNKNKKVALIAPVYAQARILMDYIAKFIVESKTISDEVDLMYSAGIERLKKEVNKSRITFRNGSDIRILSSESDKNLMGFGFDLIITDESDLIDDETFRIRITRMLGDSPDAILVQIGNPFGYSDHFKKAWDNNKYKKYKIDWKVGLQEGRISQEFVDEQRDELLPMEFRVLYEADFPDDTETEFFPLSLVRKNLKGIWEDRPDGVHAYYLGVDVAREGKDETAYVIMKCVDGQFQVVNFQTTHKKLTPETVGRIIALDQLWDFRKVMIDSTGMGAGVFDFSKDRLEGKTENINFSSKKDRDRIYLQLRKAIVETKINLIDDIKFVMQFKSYSHEYDKLGNIMISKSKTYHDDLVDALALSLDAAISCEKVNNLKFSVFGVGKGK